MRPLLLATALVACTAREPVETPRVAQGELHRRPHMAQEAAGCRHNDDGAGLSIDMPTDAEAPIVVLDEIHLHGQPPVNPRIAIWSDGEVVFARRHGDDETLVTTRIPRERAAAIARYVFELLEMVPLFTDVFVTSGGTVMRIDVEVGGRWRSAAVHGDEPDDFLAVARGAAALPKPKKEPSDMFATLDFAELKAERPWPPIGFAKAYRRLVELALSGVTPFTAYDYDVVFIAPEPGIVAGQPALAWPLELPPPPEDLIPAACHYDDRAEMEYGGGCRFIVDASYRDAAQRFRKKMWRTGSPVGVIANGATFVARFDSKYRGKRMIEAVATCSAVLGRSPDGP